MGRGKLVMRLIEKEKVRERTFKKRKACLLKKANEFSTLCGVDTCLIIYGPQLSNTSGASVEVWPPDHHAVRQIIDKYQRKVAALGGKKTFGVGDFLENRKRKTEEETAKLKRANNRAKYLTWDHRLNQLSVNEIIIALNKIDQVLERAQTRMMALKGHPLLENTGPANFYEHGVPSIISQPQAFSDHSYNYHGVSGQDCSSSLSMMMYHPLPLPMLRDTHEAAYSSSRLFVQENNNPFGIAMLPLCCSSNNSFGLQHPYAAGDGSCDLTRLAPLPEVRLRQDQQEASGFYYY